VGTSREKTGIGWKERKKGAGCAISTCGMNVAK
jgi:hypothetical protein